jgi:hypothetical protein
VFPTTTEITPTIEEAKKREKSKAENDVAFSANNTFFCNYYGLPAIVVPCGLVRTDCCWAYKLSESNGAKAKFGYGASLSKGNPVAFTTSSRF